MQYKKSAVIRIQANKPLLHKHFEGLIIDRLCTGWDPWVVLSEIYML